MLRGCYRAEGSIVGVARLPLRGEMVFRRQDTTDEDQPTHPKSHGRHADKDQEDDQRR